MNVNLFKYLRFVIPEPMCSRRTGIAQLSTNTWFRVQSMRHSFDYMVNGLVIFRSYFLRPSTPHYLWCREYQNHMTIITFLPHFRRIFFSSNSQVMTQRCSAVYWVVLVLCIRKSVNILTREDMLWWPLGYSLRLTSIFKIFIR